MLSTSVQDVRPVRQGEWRGTTSNSIVTQTVPIEASAYFGWPFGNQYQQRQAHKTCDDVTFKPEWKALAPGSSNTYRFHSTFFTQTRLTPQKMSKVMDSIRSAFSRWTEANAKVAKGFSTPLGTSFTETTTETPTIWVMYELIPNQNNQIIGGQAVASIPSGQWDGVLNSSHQLKLKFNDAPGALTAPDAFLKTALHEIGHFLGLGENYGTNPDGSVWYGKDGSSVMNPSSINNDAAKLGSMVVTSCDQKAARTYGFRAFP